MITKKNSIVLLSVILLIVTSCSYINKKLGLKDDNVIEQNIENVIERESSISVDLTPESPDPDGHG